MAYHKGPKIITDSLIGYWDPANQKSYSGTGDSLYDLSGQNNNATLYNNINFNTNSLGSFDLDGVNEYISIPDSPLWNFTNFTLDIWFKRSQAWTSASFSDALIGQSEGVGNTNKWVLTYQSSSNKILFYSNPGVGSLTSSYVFPIIKDIWYNWVITKNNTNYSFYANGGLLGTATNTGSLNNVNSPLTIGWTEDIGSFFSGSISSLKIYQKALSATEILQNFTSMKPRFSAELTAPPLVEYLAVAGGGAGGGGGFSNAGNGGGGAGGLLSGSVILSGSSTTFNVVVGSGGTATNVPTSGNNTTVFGITAVGGGRGGGDWAGAASGGSGGGAGGNWGTAWGNGTTGQGNRGGGGGSGGGGDQGAGGGGGAGAVGNSRSGGTSGAGGIGLLSNITGTSTYYAGGGGGGFSNAGGSGSGGLGGGGTGATSGGTANTGGGGGGSRFGTNSAGFNGGSGVVIIRHSSQYKIARTTGNPLVTQSGDWIIYTFNGTGTISW